ncbi:hypothetical protein T11_8984 [Trichinella zimbabwensis]|uniref:Uncharacterized protein n=1 Tax=Trichinella zimbabwensis TaxID=268475 RepID=A0A0V1GLB3_9BILA|nr:hypothetical protein T11_8984 [Trichinella zimbabwensis]
MKRHFVVSLKKNGLLGVNSVFILIVHNKWLATSEYNCRFVCAVIYSESIFYPVFDDVFEDLIFFHLIVLDCIY